jgi:hypothetical protein
VVLVSLLSFRDGAYFVSQEYEDAKTAWLLCHLLVVLIVAGICFFHVRKRFQRPVLRTSLQIACLVLFILLSGYLADPLFYLFLNLRGNLKALILFQVIAIAQLLPILFVYYALLPSSDKRKWPKKASMLLAYAMLLIATASWVAQFDNALAFYNPISTGWRFLLLLVAGALLARALFSQFKAYQPQRKWLTIGSFAVVYSVILYLSLMGFFLE